MQVSIEKLAKPAANAIFDDLKFKTIIEDHLTWLNEHPSTTVIPVNAHLIDVYDFDWVGLLLALRIPVDLHHITIRMNNGMSLTDVPQELRSLRVPSYDVIQNFIMLLNSTKRIK